MRYYFLVLSLFLIKIYSNDGMRIIKLAVSDDVKWWQHAKMYQIYPRSFQDSNGDGIGDLKGITSRLYHLKYIGVDTIWLSPIFKSPNVDFGYDVSDFLDIDPDYGTLADFDEMVTEAKKLGMFFYLNGDYTISVNRCVNFIYQYYCGCMFFIYDLIRL